MKKSDLIEGMFLKTKNESYLLVEKAKDKSLFFRFRDGSNSIIKLDQFDDNLKCGIDEWSIVRCEERKILPPLCDMPSKLSIKNIHTGEIYDAFNSGYKKKLCDGKDSKHIEHAPYYDQGSEGVSLSEGYSEWVDYYYINSLGKKEYIREDDFILIGSNEKLLVTYRYLLNNFIEI